MSNVINLMQGGGGGGGTNIETINNVGPNPVTQNISLNGQNGLQVLADAAPYTLDVFPGTVVPVSTVDDTVTNVGSVPIGLNQAVVLNAVVVGARADFSASYWGNIIIGARREAGGAILVETINPNEGDDAPFGVVVQSGARTVGNNLVLTVQGEPATDWNWKVSINYLYLV